MLCAQVGLALWQFVRQASLPLLPLAAVILEQAGGLLVLLVFQQPLDQLVARIIQLLDLFVPARKDHAGLDFQQSAVPGNCLPIV